MERKDIGLRIKRIDNLLLKQADKMLNEIGITFAQHHVLVYLVHQKNHTSTFKEAESNFKVSQATMVGLIKRLEEKGFVKSFVSDKDKRIKLLSLTKKGEEVCLYSKKSIKKGEEKMRSIFKEEEMKEFEEYLDRLYEYLNKEGKND